MIRRTSALTAVLVTAALFGACKKEKPAAKDAPATEVPAEDPKAPETPPPADPTAAAPAPGADPAAAAGAPAASEFVMVEARHEPAKPDDPVAVHFKSFKVVKADFDPQKVEGGKVELQIDLTSVESGIPKRDTHLKSKDYFDVEKMGVAKVLISDVAKGDAPDTFKAKAAVDVHGVKKSLDVTFQVVERSADGVRIKAEQPLKRSDFKVGKDKGDPAADDLLLKLDLWVKKTA